MRARGHVRAEGSGFCANMYKPCGVVEKTGRKCPEDIRRVIDEEMNSAWGLLEFGANESSAVGSSSGTSGHGKGSSGAGTSLS